MALENKKVEPSTTKKLDAELAASADEILGGEPISLPKEGATEAPGDKEGATEAPGDKEGATDVPGDKEGATEAPGDSEEYDVPEGLAPRSQERFQKLVTATKEARADLAEKDELITGFRTMLDQTGLNNQELDNLFSLGTMIKTDPAEALKNLQDVVVKLSEQVGVAPPGTDALEGFDELRDKVDAGMMSEEDASLVANAKRKQKAIGYQEEQQQQDIIQNQEQEANRAEVEVAIDKAHASVFTFLQEREKDLDFENIAPHLKEAIDFAGENLDPSQWANYIEKDYNRIKQLITLSGKATPTPLTDESSQSVGDSTPKTLDELADNVFG